MGYLEDLQVQINNRDFSKFWQLWEEYCTSDVVDVEEFTQILKAIKTSDFAKQFGQYVETALPLWDIVQDPRGKYEVLKLLIDLQTTNSPKLAELTLQALKDAYGEQPQFNERLRLVGLRTKDNFQGAISYFDLLAHMDKGKFVFHTGGWGAGEIVDLSTVREQLTIEFEHISGRKYFTFSNAFKTLIPLASDSFLARRFAAADELEKEARENSVGIVKLLLKDLGPKTASEIKDELCDLVIPEKDWSKWWQGARAKLKIDPMIESPESLRESFKIRKSEVTHEEKLHKAIGKHTDIADLIQSSYSFVRDNPAMLKKSDVRDSVKEKLLGALSDPEITEAQKLQIHLFLEQQFDHHIEGETVQKLIQHMTGFEDILDAIEIIAFKKRVLTFIREYRNDWVEIFMSLLFTPQQSTLRDYILKELNQGETRQVLIAKLKELALYPTRAPDFLVWYFQKLVSKESEGLPFSDKEGQCLFFEAFLILLSSFDSRPEYRDLSKKMYTMLSGKRYAIVRQIIDGSTFDFIQEFLLLIAKCQVFTDHDLKILRSLAEVAHPSLVVPKTRKEHHGHDSHVIWTTEEGYKRTKERLQHISTVEYVENAREIEAARALGDLRENSEYKFALERRSRLQSEIKHLSDQLNHARILTKDDIAKEEVGIGNVVEVQDPQGNILNYTILGPWDADPEKGILSAQSKLALAMVGYKKGDLFKFKDEDYKILNVKSFL